MSEYRTILDRTRQEFPAPDMPVEGVLLRRERKRRNQRFAAVIVGLAVAAAGVLAGASLLRSNPRPASSRPTPTEKPPVLRRDGEIARIESPNLSGQALVGVDPKTGRTRTLAPCADPCVLIRDFAWSPDGRWIAYSVWTCVSRAPCEPEAGIWVKGASGGPRQMMSDCFGTGCYPKGTTSFTWSPDGTRLAYVQPGRAGSEIFSVAPDGSHRTRLASSAEAFSYVRWSPDGTRIAYVLGSRLYTMRPDGTDQTHLTDPIGVDSLAWSPDGRRMVVNGGANGRGRVYIVDADGKNPRLLFDEPGFEGPSLPVWSPDGTKLAFVRTPGSSNHYRVQFWVVGTDGTNQIRLYESAMNADWDGPVWSPDGSRIAFRLATAGQDDHWYATSVDGTGTPAVIDELVALGWREA